MTRAKVILTEYQGVLMLICLGINCLSIDWQTPAGISLPSHQALLFWSIALGLLMINHAWLMTATKYCRAKYQLYTTPEESAANQANAHQASEIGLAELQRHHNCHRKDTENCICQLFCRDSMLHVLTQCIFGVGSNISIPNADVCNYKIGDTDQPHSRLRCTYYLNLRVAVGLERFK